MKAAYRGFGWSLIYRCNVKLLHTLEALYASELASYDQLWDFTAAEHVDASTDEIRRVAAID